MKEGRIYAINENGMEKVLTVMVMLSLGVGLAVDPPPGQGRAMFCCYW